MGPLEGKTALVTGGSRGIGRAIAQRLAADGALVAVHYGNNEAAVKQTVESIAAVGGRAFAVQADLGVPGDADTLWSQFDSGLKELGAPAGVDIIVNNVGIGDFADIETLTPEQFDRLFAVNVKAPFFIVQKGLPRLRDGGRIVNVSSGVTRVAYPEKIAYAMTKGAINTFGLALAKALGARRITVNSVSPGIIDTDMNADWLRDKPEARAAAAVYSVFGRVGEPDDVADVVAFAASPASRWVTGQNLDATGGSQL
ncbi:SDR family oxidoreductase [Phytohabitans houttuyneae]|uniref:Short-chain dehydrogenase n=1 Tax=Phytohabitans houttuyneae TaxID=1076126 RepID=A0A6V8KIK1_9ACTN|nr:SDR family oxidoreductase [Phytohabitans houttuyneae]GFJ83664.1 short-chain dehydrogenase [Phytohabitans houttuyneae]